MAKRANGEGTWGKKTISGNEYIRFRKKYDGVGFKEFYGKTQKEVREKIKVFERKLIENPPQKIDKNLMPFSDFMKDWLDNVKTKSIIRPLSPKTIEGMYDLYNVITKTCIADKQLTQLNKELFDKFLLELIGFNTAKSTIARIVNQTKQCLKYAYENNFTPKNFAELLYIPSEEAVLKKKKEISFLEPEDTERLYKEAKRKSVPGFSFGKPLGEYIYTTSGFVLIFIMYTGLRIGELLEIRWKDIDLQHKVLSITRNVVVLKKGEEIVKEPKTKSGIRKIPLCDRAIECLEYFDKLFPEHTSEDLVVMTKNRTRLRESNLNRTLHIASVRGGLKEQNCTLHGLRHTFGSMLLYNKVDIAIVSKLLGHAQVSTTYNIYIHIIEEQKFNAIKIFDNLKRE